MNSNPFGEENSTDSPAHRAAIRRSHRVWRERSFPWASSIALHAGLVMLGVMAIQALPTTSGAAPMVETPPVDLTILESPPTLTNPMFDGPIPCAAHESSGIFEDSPAPAFEATQPSTRPDGLLVPVLRPTPSVVYVCDASGGIMAEFDWTRQQLGKSIAALKPTQSFSIIFFQLHDANHDDDFIAMSKEMLPASPENKKRAADFLANANAYAHGGTEILPALRAAIAMHPKFIYFVLRGGCLEDAPGGTREMQKLNAHHKTRINTISLGEGDQDVTDFLKQTAKESGGFFKLITEEDLDSSSK